jgi:hypothetical protein
MLASPLFVVSALALLLALELALPLAPTPLVFWLKVWGMLCHVLLAIPHLRVLPLLAGTLRSRTTFPYHVQLDHTPPSV